MGALTSGGESNRSNIASLGTKLDPMHYVWEKALGKDYVNRFIEDGTEKLNHYASYVTKPVHKFVTKGDIFARSLEKTFGKQQFVEDWNRTVENRPVDAAAIAAAVYFGAAAAAGGSSAGAGAASAGSTAAPAASAGSTGAAVGGMTGAEAAITPTFASGIVGGSAAPAAASGFGAASTGAASAVITPTFASGVVGAGTGGASALGVAGDAALANSLTYSPMFAGGTGTVGGVAGSGVSNTSWVDTAKEIYDYGNKAKKVYDQFNPQQQNPQQQQRLPNAPNFFMGTNNSLLNQVQGQQPLDQFSSQLQSQLQNIINKQKSGSW